MASVQNRADLNNNPFVLAGFSLARNAETLFQDAGRSVALVQFTLMAKVAATGKWVPFTDETATDGTGIPQGIFLSDDVPAADLVAGDVVDQSILVGDALYDLAQLVIENSKLLTTVILATGGADNVFTQTVADYLENKGLFAESTVDIAGFEN